MFVALIFMAARNVHNKLSRVENVKDSSGGQYDKICCKLKFSSSKILTNNLLKQFSSSIFTSPLLSCLTSDKTSILTSCTFCRNVEAQNFTNEFANFHERSCEDMFPPANSCEFCKSDDKCNIPTIQDNFPSAKQARINPFQIFSASKTNKKTKKN